MTDQELDELEARLPVIVETLASLNMDISLEAWNYISNNILSSADAIAELREKNAGLVGALRNVSVISAGPRSSDTGARFYAPLDALDTARAIARKAIEENTQ